MRRTLWISLLGVLALSAFATGLFPHQALAAPRTENVRSIVLDQIGTIDTGYQGFDNGVPVGYYAQLTLYSNGNYTFFTHFHVSGATSYDESFVWDIIGSTGTLFTFSHHGHVAGTFEPGSRDDDQLSGGNNPDIAAGWNDLAAHYHWEWRAKANMDIGALWNDVKAAVEAVQTVAKVVAVVG